MIGTLKFVYMLSYDTVAFIACITKLSPSSTTLKYLIPSIASDYWKPAAIIIAPIAVEEPLQFLSTCGGELCFCAMEQMAQYVFAYDINIQ